MGKTKFAGALAIAVIGLGVPGAIAGGSTQVTIKAMDGDFSGKVKGDPTSCRANRSVKVKKEANGKDPTVASGTSESNGSWSTGNTGADPGKYYAKVRKTNDCGKARSGTVTVTAR